MQRAVDCNNGKSVTADEVGGIINANAIARSSSKPRSPPHPMQHLSDSTEDEELDDENGCDDEEGEDTSTGDEEDLNEEEDADDEEGSNNGDDLALQESDASSTEISYNSQLSEKKKRLYSLSVSESSGKCERKKELDLDDTDSKKKNDQQHHTKRDLAQACLEGKLHTVMEYFECGATLTDTSDDGDSLLMLACSAGHYKLAKALLEMGAPVDDRGTKGDNTPLMEAASNGFSDIVSLLIEYNAEVNAPSSVGNTALTFAAGGGYADVARILLEAGANIEDHNENGHTPLMEAASSGHVQVAEVLLEHGAGINTHSNEFKESALTLACYKGHLEMVRFLLEAGADREHKTDEMHTALMEASMDGHVEVARLLLDSGAQVNMPTDSFESPLTLAACGGHVELAKLLLERGANIEEKNDEGYTPLMEAAREGHGKMVALLLEKGAKINEETEETKETALTLACCGGFVDVAELLIKNGADIEKGTSTPLMEASQEGQLELVKYLLQNGASVHAQTQTGDTALTYACENGHTDVAEVLLMHKANLEHNSEGGRTPLMKACRAGHLDTVEFLIEQGADVNRRTTNNDHTPLSLACAGGHVQIIRHLINSGANVYHKLKDNSTMLIEAAKGGHTDVVQLLLDFPQPNKKTPVACPRELLPPENIVSTVKAASKSTSTPSSGTAIQMKAPSAEPCLSNFVLSEADKRNILFQQLLNKAANRMQEMDANPFGIKGSAEKMNITRIPDPMPEMAPPLNESPANEQAPDLSLTGATPPVAKKTCLFDKSFLLPKPDAGVMVKNLIELEVGKQTGIEGSKGEEGLYLAKVDVESNNKMDVSSNGSWESVANHLILPPPPPPSLNGSMEDGEDVATSPLKSEGERETHEAANAFPLSGNQVFMSAFLSDNSNLEMINSMEAPLPPMMPGVFATHYPDICPEGVMPFFENVKLMSPEMIRDDPGLVSQKELLEVDAELLKQVESDMYNDMYNTANIERAIKKQREMFYEYSTKQFNLNASAHTSSNVSSQPQLAPSNKRTINMVNDEEAAAASLYQFASCVTSQPYTTALSNSSTTVSAATKQHQNEPNLPPSFVFQPSSNIVVNDRPKAKSARKDGNRIRNTTQLQQENPAFNITTEEIASKMNSLLQYDSVDAICRNYWQSDVDNHDRVEIMMRLMETDTYMERVNAALAKWAPTCSTSVPPILAKLFSNDQLLIQIRELEEEEASGGRAWHASFYGKKQGSERLVQKVDLYERIKKEEAISELENCIDANPPMSNIAAHPLEMFEKELYERKKLETFMQGMPPRSSNHKTFKMQHQLVKTSPPMAQAKCVETKPKNDQCQQTCPNDVLASKSTLVREKSPVLKTTGSKIRVKEVKELDQVQTAPPRPQTTAEVKKMTSTRQTQTLPPKVTVADQPAARVRKNFSQQTLTVAKSGAEQQPPPVKKITEQRPHPASIMKGTPTITTRKGRCQRKGHATAVKNSNHTHARVPATPNVNLSAMDVDTETESNHDTALTLACAGGHEDLVKLLLSRGANIEHKDKKGFTPLILAATAGHEKIVDYLLNQGAKIEAQSERTKDTALSLACSGGRYEVVELLLLRNANKEHRNVSDYTPLSLAASGGYVNIIKLLLGNGAEINSRSGSKLGISPLMLAAMNGHVAAAKLLLESGSDINAQIETNKNTALTLACFQGRHEVVALLVDRKANIEHRAKTGLTPLMEAANGGFVEVARVLLEKGADVNASPVVSSRETCLTLACDKAHVKLVELLLANDAHVEVRNKKGATPMWLACNNGNLAIMEMLHAAGAELDVQDNRKVSCLMAAFKKGFSQAVQWIVQRAGQYPSDQDMMRYMAMISEADLLEKCGICLDIIRVAKDRQAEKANQFATILLEELDQEKSREELKRIAAEKRKEKKRLKRLEKIEEKYKLELESLVDSEEQQQQEEQCKLNKKGLKKVVAEVEKKALDCLPISKMQRREAAPSSSRKNNNVEVEEGDGVIGKLHGKGGKSTSKDRTAPKENYYKKKEDAPLNSEQHGEKRQSRSMEQNNAKIKEKGGENGEREKDKDKKSVEKGKEKGCKNVKIKGQSKSPDDICDKAEVEMEKVKNTSIMNSVIFVNANNNKWEKVGEKRDASNKLDKKKHVKLVFEASKNSAVATSISSSAEIDSDSGTGNGGSNKKKKLPYNVEDGMIISASSASTVYNVVSTNNKQNAKRGEEGWKEVVRKYLSPTVRSKKVSVPLTAISRVIGRGGSNINAIRSSTGAHIEVEKQCKGQGERIITIKGSTEATRQAYQLIITLIEEPETDLSQMMPNFSKLSISNSNTWDKGNISAVKGKVIATGPQIAAPSGPLKVPVQCSISSTITQVIPPQSKSISVDEKKPCIPATTCGPTVTNDTSTQNHSPLPGGAKTYTSAAAAGVAKIAANSPIPVLQTFAAKLGENSLLLKDGSSFNHKTHGIPSSASPEIPSPSPTSQPSPRRESLPNFVSSTPPEYSLFNDTFPKAAAQSLWLRDVCEDSHQKVMNFAGVAASGTINNIISGNSTCQYADTESLLEVDAAKAPGYRGSLTCSPNSQKLPTVTCSGTRSSVPTVGPTNAPQFGDEPFDSSVRNSPDFVARALFQDKIGSNDRDPSSQQQQQHAFNYCNTSTTISMSRLNPAAPDFSTSSGLKQQASTSTLFKQPYTPYHPPHPHTQQQQSQLAGSSYQGGKIPPTIQRQQQQQWPFSHQPQPASSGSSGTFLQQPEGMNLGSLMQQQADILSNMESGLGASSSAYATAQMMLDTFEQRGKNHPKPIGMERASWSHCRQERVLSDVEINCNGGGGGWMPDMGGKPSWNTQYKNGGRVVSPSSYNNYLRMQQTREDVVAPGSSDFSFQQNNLNDLLQNVALQSNFQQVIPGRPDLVDNFKLDSSWELQDGLPPLLQDKPLAQGKNSSHWPLGSWHQ